MKTLFNFILIFTATKLFTSCGIAIPLIKDYVEKKPGEVRQFNSTDPVFKSYISEFEAHARQQNGDQSFLVGDIPINFGNTENDQYQGVCFQYTNGQKEILIRKVWWNSVNKKYQKSLLFHELGHCRLNREHKNETVNKLNRSYKLSIMNAVIVSNVDYDKFESEYLYELFNKNEQLIIASIEQLTPQIIPASSPSREVSSL
jgi:hypothetical protein